MEPHADPSATAVITYSVLREDEEEYGGVLVVGPGGSVQTVYLLARVDFNPLFGGVDGV